MGSVENQYHKQIHREKADSSKNRRELQKKKEETVTKEQIILPNDVERIKTLCHSSTTEAV